MRVLTLVAALIATPVLAAMSQDPGQAATSAAAAGKCATADERRSANSWEGKQPEADPKSRSRVGCSPVAPTPPPPPPSGAAIVGRVFDGDVNGLANWTVTLSGTVTATAVTDASGSFAFRGLQAGTYIVCEAWTESWQDVWFQYWPRFGTTKCSSPGTGLGYTLVITAADVAAQAGFVVHFGNLIPQ